MDAHPDALLRSCAQGHLTGAVALVDPSGARVLLLHHPRMRRWLQPGGHADGEADLVAVARREAVEETGIDGLVIDPVPIDVDVHETGEGHLHLDVRFRAVAPAGAEHPVSPEGHPLRWFSAEELRPPDVDPDTARFLLAALVESE